MPNWKHKIYFSDLQREGIGLAFEDRAAIAQRFRESAWFKEDQKDGYGDLESLIEELEDVEDVKGFAIVIGAIYDEADYGHACFIDTVSPMPGAVRV